jgi:acyl carrier protein
MQVKHSQLNTAHDDLSQQVLNILADILAIDCSELTDDTDLVEDLGIESIELVNIVAAIEERMAVALDVRQLMNVRTLHQVVALVASSQPKRP